MEINMDIFKKPKIEIPFDLDIPLLDIFPKEFKLTYYKYKYMSNFIAAQFSIDLRNIIRVYFDFYQYISTVHFDYIPCGELIHVHNTS